MRPVGRKDDLVLLGGLIVALLVIVSPALGELLAIVQEIERGQGRRVLQLATVLVFQQSRQRHEVRAQALAASAIAKHATERAAEMARLAAFGQALGRALDMDSIKQAAAAHIPLLAPGRSAWAMVRTGTSWNPLAVIDDSTPAECERAARRAVGETEPTASEETRDTCFPMIIGGRPIGVLAVASDPPLTDRHHRVIGRADAALYRAKEEGRNCVRIGEAAAAIA